MGYDINITLVYGFKIPLSLAADLLDLDIVLCDDYKYLTLYASDEEREEIYEDFVDSSALKNILKKKGLWNIYILTSSQGDCNPDKSYFILFNKTQELYSGRRPDYETGTVKIDPEEVEEEVENLSDSPLWKYELHWIAKGSW